MHVLAQMKHALPSLQELADDADELLKHMVLDHLSFLRPTGGGLQSHKSSPATQLPCHAAQQSSCQAPAQQSRCQAADQLSSRSSCPAENAGIKRRREVLTMPRQMQLLAKLRAAHPECHHPSVSFDLAPLSSSGLPAKPGTVLAHCRAAVACRVEGHLVVFKVGITLRPDHRFCNKQFGYFMEGYHYMVLLHCEHDSRACGYLEAALIGHFRSTQGCQNEAPGGEGFSLEGTQDHQSYLYLVVKNLSRLPPERQRTAIKSRCAKPLELQED